MRRVKKTNKLKDEKQQIALCKRRYTRIKLLQDWARDREWVLACKQANMRREVR